MQVEGEVKRTRAFDGSVLMFLDSDLEQPFFDRMTETILLNGIPLQILRFKGSSVQSFDFVVRLPDLQVFESDQQQSANTI